MKNLLLPFCFSISLITACSKSSTLPAAESSNTNNDKCLNNNEVVQSPSSSYYLSNNDVIVDHKKTTTQTYVVESFSTSNDKTSIEKKILPNSNNLDENAPKGLPNVGNTCYINTAFQALAAIIPTELLNTTSRHSFINESNIIINKIQKNQYVGNKEMQQLASELEKFDRQFTQKKEHSAQDLLKLYTENSNLPKCNFTLNLADASLFDVCHFLNPIESFSFNDFNEANEEYILTIYGFKNLYSGATSLHDIKQKRIPFMLDKIAKSLEDNSVFMIDFTRPIDNSNDLYQNQYQKIAYEDKIPFEHNSYSLKAFTQHLGSVESGHYIAYVRKNNQWYQCDDKTVQAVSEEDIKEKVTFATQLFYVKKT